MRSGWQPGDLVLAPGVLVIALSHEMMGDEEIDHALVLAQGRLLDVWLVPTRDTREDRYQWREPSQRGGIGHLIFHPKHCRPAVEVSPGDGVE